MLTFTTGHLRGESSGGRWAVGGADVYPGCWALVEESNGVQVSVGVVPLDRESSHAANVAVVG